MRCASSTEWRTSIARVRTRRSTRNCARWSPIPHNGEGICGECGVVLPCVHEEAQKLWEEYNVWEKQVLKEKREYRHNRVSGGVGVDG